MKKKCEGSPIGTSHLSRPRTGDCCTRIVRCVMPFGRTFGIAFARCPDLPIREFRSYLADFPRLGAAEAASCEGVVTECEVRDALKQVGLNKSPGLDGLPYECVLEDVAHVRPYSDGCVQPLVRPGSHPW